MTTSTKTVNHIDVTLAMPGQMFKHQGMIFEITERGKNTGMVKVWVKGYDHPLHFAPRAQLEIVEAA